MEDMKNYGYTLFRTIPKNGAAGTPASLKNQKTALLELQQGQKSKKRSCWNSSKPSRIESIAAL